MKGRNMDGTQSRIERCIEAMTAASAEQEHCDGAEKRAWEVLCRYADLHENLCPEMLFGIGFHVGARWLERSADEILTNLIDEIKNVRRIAQDGDGTGQRCLEPIPDLAGPGPADGTESAPAEEQA